MNKLWEILKKIEVKNTSILLFVLAIIFGQAKTIFLYFLIALIHELFHLLMCIFLKIKINKFTILPFGASLSIDEVELISSKKQLLIYLAGPLSILFNLIWINVFHHLKIINYVNYNLLNSYNVIMCLLNLIPIFPLDGYMIIKALFQLIFPYLKALKISTFISLFGFIAFAICNIIYFQPMVLFFLLIEQIKHIYEYERIYKKFLIYKTNSKKEKKYKIIKNYKMFKDVNNYKIEKEKILDDNDIAIIELNRIN